MPNMTAGRHPTSVQSKPLVDVDSCGLERRRQPEQNADEHAEAQREQQHASVDGDLFKARDVGRRKRNQRSCAGNRDRDAKPACGECLNQRFDQELPDDPGAARTERTPDGDLRNAGGGLGQEQRGHRGARNQQHEADRAKQQIQHGRDVADHLALKSRDEHADVLVRVGVFHLEARGDSRHLGLRLFEADAGLQPRKFLFEHRRAMRQEYELKKNERGKI